MTDKHNIMDNTDYEILGKYETELNRAVNCGYSRNMTQSARKELAAVYQHLFNAPGNDLLSSCSTCLFNGLKRLGLAYFQTKEKREKIENEKPVIEEKLDNEEKSNADSIQVPEETETPQEDYGTIDGLPVPQDDETPDQVQEPDVTPEKEKVTIQKTQNKKTTTKTKK